MHFWHQYSTRVQVWNLMDVRDKFSRSKRLEALPLFQRSFFYSVSRNLWIEKGKPSSQDAAKSKAIIIYFQNIRK